jgi:dTMP kinase
MKEGKLIAFEGIDGCGKSTQLRLLARFLEEKGIEVVVTREPGGTALGEEIRRVLLHTSPGPVPKAELLLYLADRVQHVEEVIRPALALGKVVLTDRFYLSTLAYQCYGRGLSQEIFRVVTEWSLGGLKPHTTLLFDLPVSEIPSRLAGEKDRLESEYDGFFERVRRGFLDEAQRDESVVVLDATLPEDLLHSKVVKLVSPLVEIS